MDIKISLQNLKSVFTESLEREEPTLAFELSNGKGRFLFMMFFDEKDNETKDILFLFLKNSRRMLKLKMYGNHLNGQFDIYLKPFMIGWFKEELELKNLNSNNPFDIENFFFQINRSIPQQLPLITKIDTLRRTWHDVKEHLPNDVVDENDKIYLMYPKVLPKNMKPQEKTLRKLYLYINGNSNEISELINYLKRMNTTVCWNADESYKGKTISMIQKEI
ncbi:MAG: hypothetical protein JW870_13580 [Candidatus Delongbacteria bacterium]|nr:hypothetical protein [Candidatus Delongbacteria bacterium]